MSFNLSAWAAKSLQKLEGTLDEAFGFDESKSSSNDQANKLSRSAAVVSNAQPNGVPEAAHQSEKHIASVPRPHTSKASHVLSADSPRSESAQKRVSHSQSHRKAEQNTHQGQHDNINEVQSISDQPSESPPLLCESKNKSGLSPIDTSSHAAKEVTSEKNQNLNPPSPEVLSAVTTSEKLSPVVPTNSSKIDVLPVAPDPAISEPNAAANDTSSSQQSEKKMAESNLQTLPPSQNELSSHKKAMSPVQETHFKANSCDDTKSPSRSENEQSQSKGHSSTSESLEIVHQANQERTINMNSNATDTEKKEKPQPSQPPLTSKQRESTVSSNDLTTRYRKVALTLRRREAEFKKLSSVMNTAREEHEKTCSELASCKKSLNDNLTELEQVKKERNVLSRAQEDYAAAQTLLAAKDDQIAAVLSEGEKLSVKQAKMEATIRNVRSELKDKKSEIERLEGLVSSHKKAAEEARQKHAQSGENDRARIEKLAALSERCQNLEKELLRVSSELQKETAKLSSATETTSRLEAKIQVQEKDMLRWKQEAENSRAQWNREAIASKKQQEASRSGEERESVLRRSVARLREEMQQLETEKAESIRSLSHELMSSRKQLLEAESKAEQLASAIPEATGPLLQQIASLQQTLQLRSDTWNEMERSLVTRCKAAEVEQLRLQDCLSSAQTESAELSRRVEEQSTKMAAITADQLQQSAHVQRLEEKALVHEEHRKQAEKLQLQAEQARLCQVALETRVQELQQRFDSEKQKLIQDLEAQYEAGRVLKQRLEEMQRCPEPTRSSSAVEVESELERTTTESIRSVNGPVRHSSMSSFGSQDNESSAILHANWPSPGESFGHNVHLQASIRRKQGEIQQLKRRLNELEDERGALSDELVSLKSEQAKWEASSRKYMALERQMQELRTRHDTALDLIGTLREENEELKADLTDVKTVYRSQISEVMSQMEALRATSSSS